MCEVGMILSLLNATVAAMTQQPAEAAMDGATVPVTMFPHTERSRYFAAGQANIVFRKNPPFHSPHEGANSFVGRGEYKTSLVGTLYLGMQLNRNPRWQTEVLLDFESSGGRGLSQALGLARFTNLDVVRNPSLGSKPYLARVQVHGTLPLGKDGRQQPGPVGAGDAAAGETGGAAGGQDEPAGFSGLKFCRQRQPPAVYELDNRQPGGVGLCGGYAGVHLGCTGGGGFAEL